MLAKRKEDRYDNVTELLEDLETVAQGQTPLRAHKRFDLRMLESLEKGEEVEIEREPVYREEAVNHYRIAVMVLSIVSAVSILGVILLISRLVAN